MKDELTKKIRDACFTCTLCGACCSGADNEVMVSPDEVEALMQETSLSCMSASTSSGDTITSLSAPEQHAPQSEQVKHASWIFLVSSSFIDSGLRVRGWRSESLPA